MKNLLFAGFLLSAVTCQSNTNNTSVLTDSDYVQQAEDTTSLAGTWKLMPVLASDTATGNIPEINFDLTSSKFTGNTGCNKMSGSFKLEKDALSFGANVVSTKMACPGYNEDVFFENLLKTNRFEIEDGVLKLMYNTTVLSKWVRNTAEATTKQI